MALSSFEYYRKKPLKNLDSISIHFPDNHLPARQWIGGVIADRLSNNYHLVPEKRTNWEIRIGDIFSLSFPDLLIPKLHQIPTLKLSSVSTFESGIKGYAPLSIIDGGNLAQTLTHEKSTYEIIKADVFGMSFWALSHWEEIYGNPKYDSHDRFVASSSYTQANCIHDRPWVDEWINFIREKITKRIPSFKLTPQDARVNLSHDVDHPSRFAFCPSLVFLKRLLGDFFLYKKFNSLIKAPLSRFTSQKAISEVDRWNTFDWLMDKSEEHGLVSTFNFQIGDSTHPKDAYYQINDPPIRELIKKIHDRGHQVGFHPSYNASINRKIFKGEAKSFFTLCGELNIDQEEWGGRMHYLRFRSPGTFHLWESSGFTYDGSMGFADSPGFRSGTCFEYAAYDPTRKQQLGLKIRPLVVMDCSAFPHNPSEREKEKALDELQELKMRCLTVGGTFSLLWHNNYFLNEEVENAYLSLIR